MLPLVLLDDSSSSVIACSLDTEDVASHRADEVSLELEGPHCALGLQEEHLGASRLTMTFQHQMKTNRKSENVPGI